MNNILNEIFTNTSTDITISSTIITMLCALFTGILTAVTYRFTQKEEKYSQSLAVTLCMLPVILSVIITFVGSNAARAFSLAGTLSIIRFRSTQGDPKDIGYIFFAVGAGLASGVGMYGYAVLFTVLLCAVLIILEKTNAFREKSTLKALRIFVPEDLNYENAFDDILKKYTQKYTLTKVKTAELGALFEIVYTVCMKNGSSEREFINELRCRNGNLGIMLSLAPDANSM